MVEALEDSFVQLPAARSLPVFPTDAVELFESGPPRRHDAAGTPACALSYPLVASSDGDAGHVTLRLARGITGEFKARPDPTVQRSLDELLMRLQVQYDGGAGSSAVLSRSFTAGPTLLAFQLDAPSLRQPGEPPSRQELALLGMRSSRRIHSQEFCESAVHCNDEMRLSMGWSSDVKYVVSI